MTVSRDSSVIEKYSEGNARLDAELTEIAKICGTESFIGNDDGGYVKDIFVAYNGEKPIGYGGTLSVLDEAEISHICVLPEYRGKGIGNAIIIAMLGNCRKNGIVKVCLEVREKNAPAIAIYRKHGFVPCGIIKNYYSNPVENAVRMVLQYENTGI